MRLKQIYEDIFSDSDYALDVTFALEKQYDGKGLHFHGTPRLNKINTISDIKPEANTVESDYLYVTPYIKTAVTYASIGQYKFHENSGILILKLRGGKKYKFTRDDINMSGDWNAFNARLDQLKAEGYEYVTGTQGTQEVIILNNDILQLTDRIFIKDVEI